MLHLQNCTKTAMKAQRPRRGANLHWKKFGQHTCSVSQARSWNETVVLVSVPPFDFPMVGGGSSAGHSRTRAAGPAMGCDSLALADSDDYWGYSRTAGHSADAVRVVEHDMEGLALEDHDGRSHRWKTWSARPEAWSNAAAMLEGLIVSDKALP